ncbi:MAG: c-type cytochrome [Planctomycetes bacterium]|nr:c-type cytochrome [Planctomycetota bacterium]
MRNGLAMNRDSGRRSQVGVRFRCPPLPAGERVERGGRLGHAWLAAALAGAIVGLIVIWIGHSAPVVSAKIAAEQTIAARVAPPPPPPDGAALFKENCATCHGDTGGGDGPAAVYLFPKPRNFNMGLFKIRSTATGALPTDDDLMATLERGMPGSAMPSFAFLSTEERAALVQQVKSFAVIETDDGEKFNLFEKRRNPRVIPVAQEPAASEALVQKGAAVYKAQSCAKCHGETGIGDGPSAPTLKDELGFPIPPANFTRGLYKGGSAARDIYMRFTTGMSGTPMPSFEESLSDEDRWALAYYVKSLERKGRPSIPAQKSEILIAGPRVASLLVDPFDAAWANVPVTELPLMHLWQRIEATDIVKVRVVHDGISLAVLMEWDDATMNGAVLRPQEFADAAALMFSLNDTAGHFTMGEKGKPCNIWQWRMDRQLDLAKYGDLEDIYPGMAADDYPMSKGDKVHRPPATPDSYVDTAFLTGTGARNPVSDIHRQTPVQDMNSIGFGTLECQPDRGQNVDGRGVWKSGVWRVVFWRNLPAGDSQDVHLQAGGKYQIGFAVWDGAFGDRDGQKSVTYWQVLHLGD